MSLLPYFLRNPIFLLLEGIAFSSVFLLLFLAATSRSPLTRLDAISVSISAVTIVIGLFRIAVLVEWGRLPDMAFCRMRREFTMGGYYNIILWTILLTAIRMTPSAPYALLVRRVLFSSIS